MEPTPNSELLKSMKETENQFKIDKESRIKFVEKAGIKNRDILRKSDPHKTNCSPDVECLACHRSTTISDCKKSNVGYSIICELCESRGVKMTYEGETSRNMFLRGSEHLRQLKNKSTNSVLFKHIVNDHPNEQNSAKFRMVKTGSFKKPLSRQINEGIRIKNAQEGTLMNSKKEFYGPSVHRIVFQTN